jgi:hypothetical protein
MGKSQMIILMLGIACLCIGIFRSEAAEVLQKATLVCLECIGLG